ncbi:MAG: NAD-dependent epimerase/dehydratase family protein [Deltaproteobacteria bacterium]|jgi:UDP-glucose 4-epimerase|nr:NAD-dependent epimerase/dehydratase family protein [Deltaproteobacteria bacterium]
MTSIQCLVTGGAGFIGSHLTEALIGLGLGVRVYDSLRSGRLENLRKVQNKVEFVEADVLDPAALAQAMAGTQVVFHLAAVTSVPESLKDPSLYLRIDGQGTFAVLEAAAQAGAKRVVLASTSAVYGDGPCPQVETQAPQADNPYAAAKLLGENLGLYYQKSRGLEVICLRLFNVYGPRQGLCAGEASVIDLFAQAALAGQSPVVFGDGEQTRDFVEVRDAVRAFVLAGRSPYPRAGIFNVGTGQAVSINHLCRLLKELVPSLPPPTYAPPRPGDSFQSMAATAKAAKVLKFSAHIDVWEGLASFLAYQAAGKKAAAS